MENHYFLLCQLFYNKNLLLLHGFRCKTLEKWLPVHGFRCKWLPLHGLTEKPLKNGCRSMVFVVKQGEKWLPLHGFSF